MILVISIILTNALIGKSNLVPAFREPPGGARRQGRKMKIALEQHAEPRKGSKRCRFPPLPGQHSAFARCEQRGPGQQGNKSGTAGEQDLRLLNERGGRSIFLSKNKDSERLAKRLARKAGGKPLGLPCSRTLCFPANPSRFFTREKTAFFFL